MSSQVRTNAVDFDSRVDDNRPGRPSEQNLHLIQNIMTQDPLAAREIRLETA